jgi:hypothetical protein
MTALETAIAQAKALHDERGYLVVHGYWKLKEGDRWPIEEYSNWPEFAAEMRRLAAWRVRGLTDANEYQAEAHSAGNFGPLPLGGYFYQIYACD